MLCRATGKWELEGWEVGIEILNRAVGSLTEATAEQRPHSGEGVNLGEHVSLSPTGILPHFLQFPLLPGSWFSNLRKAG